MKSEIRIENRAGCAVIDIEGIIGVPEDAQFAEPGERVATWERFRAACGRIGEVDAGRVRVNIRSCGGDVGDALLIYDALSSLPGEVTTRCCGYVASAATVVAQAAAPGRRELAPGTLYLVHRSQSAAEGTARSLSAAGELLEKTDDRIAAIYASRGGRPESFFRALMDENEGRGRWMTAEEAVEAGLADRVSESEEAAACRAAGKSEGSCGEKPESGPDKKENAGPGFGGSPPDAAAGKSPAGSKAGPAASDAGPEAAAAAAAVGLAAAAVKPPANEGGETSGFDAAAPTRTEPAEDPPLTERSPSPNERAYERDLRRMLER